MSLIHFHLSLGFRFDFLQLNYCSPKWLIKWNLLTKNLKGHS